MKTLKELLMLDNPAAFLRELDARGMLSSVLPELASLRMDIPKGFHHKDNLEHSIKVLENSVSREVNGPDVILRAAALLHDIGKPATREFHEKGKVSFTNHEAVGARMSKKILKKHGFTQDEIQDISLLIKLHMRSHTFKSGWGDSAVRRLISDVRTKEQLDRLCIIFFSDVTTKNASRMNNIHVTVQRLKNEMERVKAKDFRDSLRPAINGHEVMEMFGLQPGRELGAIMKFLNSDEGILLSRDQAIQKVQELLKKS